MVIWKLKLEAGKVRYEIPKFAKVLCIQTQYGEPCIWFMCDSTQPKDTRCFEIIGTGHEFSEDLIEDYIGTFQLHQGSLVFHVFETTHI